MVLLFGWPCVASIVNIVKKKKKKNLQKKNRLADEYFAYRWEKLIAE